MKKIITLLMCLICCSSYAFLYEENGGTFLNETFTSGTYLPPVIDPTKTPYYLSLYSDSTKQAKVFFDVWVNDGDTIDITSFLPSGYSLLDQEGHHFGAWIGSGSNEVSAVTINGGNDEVYARWDLNHYYIFVTDSEGGRRIQKAYGDPLSDVVASAKTGYSFSKWLDANDAEYILPQTMPNYNITVVADYSINNYNYTFITDANPSGDVQSITYGQPVTYSGDTSKEGYSFTGWQPELPLTMPADNSMVSTAQYAIKHYTITWRITDYSKPSPAVYESTTANVEYGSVIVASDTPAVPDGFRFTGWNIPETMPDNDNLVIEASIKGIPVYGFTVKTNDPTTFQYTDDAVGMSCLTYNTPVTDNFDDSDTSWKSFIYEIARPCILKPNGTVDTYLKRDNIYQNEDGTTSELARTFSSVNDTGNNAMVELKTLYSYLSIDPSTKVMTFKVSTRQKTQDFKPTGFIKSDGTTLDKIYIGMFSCSVQNSKTRSVRYNSGRLNYGKGEVGCLDNKPEYYQHTGYRAMDYSVQSLIDCLKFMMYGGIITGSTSNFLSLYYDINSSGLSPNFCCGQGKFMWIENTYDPRNNMYSWTGIAVTDRTLYVKDRPPYNVPITAYTNTGLTNLTTGGTTYFCAEAAMNMLVFNQIQESGSSFGSILYNANGSSLIGRITNTYWWVNAGNNEWTAYTNNDNGIKQYVRLIYTNDPSSRIIPMSAPMMMSAPRQQIMSSPSELEQTATPTEELKGELQ